MAGMKLATLNDGSRDGQLAVVSAYVHHANWGARRAALRCLSRSGKTP